MAPRGKWEQVEVPGAPAVAQAVGAERQEWVLAEREAMVERPAPGPVVPKVAMAATQASAPLGAGRARGLLEVPGERAERRLASPSDRRARAAVSAAPSCAPAVARCR